MYSGYRGACVWPSCKGEHGEERVLVAHTCALGPRSGQQELDGPRPREVSILEEEEEGGNKEIKSCALGQ